MYRQDTRGKAKSGAVVKHQMKLVVLKTTSNVKGHFKSSFGPFYRSLVTSLMYMFMCIVLAVKFVTPFQDNIYYLWQHNACNFKEVMPGDCQRV